PALDVPFWRLLCARFYPLARRALPETLCYKALGEPPNKLVITRYAGKYSLRKVDTCIDRGGLALNGAMSGGSI
ncbi:MAG: hypothetical protein ACREOH_16050, partial [Candidatus Entotheonellia bacterium]